MQISSWAVVTGASRDVAADYARKSAQEGKNVVLVGSDPDRFTPLAQELKQSGGEVRVVKADLSNPEGLKTVFDSTAGLEVDRLVHVAENPRSLQEAASSALGLVHHYGNEMAASKGGQLVLGAEPNALGGFTHNLADSLKHELKTKNIDVQTAPTSPKLTRAWSRVTETVAAKLAAQDIPSAVSLKERYGPWAVVTGASQGIGAEFADRLAEEGMNVVLVARSADKLEAEAQRLREEHGVQVRTVSADLSDARGVDKVLESTSDLEVGLLVNNAGSWQFGEFLRNDVQRDQRSVSLNMEAPGRLMDEFGSQMVEWGRGGIINVGSGAALHGVPGQSAYSATKGYLLSLSEQRYQEWKPHGVDVLITNPGPVKGEAGSVYDQSKIPMQKLTAGQVVDDSLRHLGDGPTTMPGWLNKVGTTVALRLLGRDTLAAIAGMILERAA